MSIEGKKLGLFWINQIYYIRKNFESLNILFNLQNPAETRHSRSEMMCYKFVLFLTIICTYTVITALGQLEYTVKKTAESKL